jgi:hypothetical protein
MSLHVKQGCPVRHHGEHGQISGRSHGPGSTTDSSCSTDACQTQSVSCPAGRSRTPGAPIAATVRSRRPAMRDRRTTTSCSSCAQWHRRQGAHSRTEAPTRPADPTRWQIKRAQRPDPVANKTQPTRPGCKSNSLTAPHSMFPCPPVHTKHAPASRTASKPCPPDSHASPMCIESQTPSSDRDSTPAFQALGTNAPVNPL